MRAHLLFSIVFCLEWTYGALEGLLSSKDPDPPPPLYPIGARSGPFARVSGRLFEIDNEIGYFSGMT